MNDRKPIVGVGMSGGTDSSLTAYLLAEQGCEVRGFTLRLWHEASTKSSDAHIQRAREVAAKLGIAHRVVDLSEAFLARIVEPFVAEYAAGRTPSPCVCCNMRFKFGLMLDLAREDGCDALATGHYVRTFAKPSGRIGLRRGADDSKDQSYFLAGLTQAQLAAARFPLGELEKRDVKVRADALGLIPHGQAESQDLCFIPDGDCAAFLARRRPDLVRPGPIVAEDGEELGTHDGAFRYTIGQRRGLGLSGGPWYVVRTDVERNLVVVGERASLMAHTVRLSGFNWVGFAPVETLDVLAQLRYNMRPVPAQLRMTDDTTAALTFAEPVSAVTPGQFAVAYVGEEVAGGGWIEEGQ
jgi:tRNA-specific 2-thiouridylase